MAALGPHGADHTSPDQTGPDHAGPDWKRRPEVRLAGLVVAALTLGFLFLTSVVNAYHAPAPHDVPIATVGPAQAVAEVRTALDKRAPGAFDLKPYQSVTTAKQAVADRQVDAVFVLPAAAVSGGGPASARVIIASAIGAESANAISSVFVAVGKAMGANVTVDDIAPLPPGDPLGVASYFFAVALYMPSFLGGILLTFAASRSSILSKAAAAVVFAILLGIIEVAVVDGMIGALAGHAVELAAVGMLTSLAFVATVVALGAALGPAGVGLSTLTFLVAGIPASGGPFGVSFLPTFYRIVGPGLPLTNAATVIRNVVYFGGRATGAPLGVLACWAGGGVIVLAILAYKDRRRDTIRRHQAVPVAAGAG